MFTDNLEIKLSLSIDGESFEIPGANVKSIRINFRSFGFKAGISFWVSSESAQDKLFSRFIKDDLIEVKLNIEPHFKPQDADIEPFNIQGLVTGKSILTEFLSENIHLKDNPVLYRHYQVDFADSARVLWTQHFPCDIIVNGSVKDLIEANKGTGVALRYDWEALNEKFAINTLPLDSLKNRISFYDFLLWYTADKNGVFNYNSKTNEYTLAAAKDQNGKAGTMSKLEIEDHKIEFPPTIRFNDRFLNVFSENPQIKNTERNQAKKEIRRDTLLRLPIASDFDKAFNLESKKEKNREHEIFLTHRRFPLLTYMPGVFVKLEDGLWSRKIFLHDKEYRVRNIDFTARSVNENADADHNMSFSKYNIEMQSRLELKTDASLNLPDFKIPVYPVYVEGKIISEQGEEEDETYQIYQHSQTSLDQYKISIPIFDNKQIVAPFGPLFASGHFYFPAYKGERVLVALDFHDAGIVSFLDWKPGVRLPMDSQGDHLLLGKNSTNDNTSISHVYIENKPQLNIKRTFSSDTEKIQLHEGRIVFETKEE